MRRFTNKTSAIVHDIIAAILAWQIAWLARFNFAFPYPDWELSFYTLLPAIVVQSLIFWRFHLYKGIWRFASIPDLWNIFRAALFGSLCISLTLFILFRLQGVPRSIFVLYPMFLIFFLGGPRLGYRLWKDHSLSLNTISAGTRVLVIGAGRGGEMLIREMLRTGQYVPVGILDDNETLKGSEIHGIRIIGTIDRIAEMSERYGATLAIIAIPSASNEEMQGIVNRCEDAGIALRTLPPLTESVSTQNPLGNLREVSIEDLLGRDKVELDWQELQKGISNQVIMVSGGGGSIGTELCLQIAKLGPKVLIIYERSEFSLYRVRQQLNKAYPAINCLAILGDVCDQEKVRNTLDTHQPEIIFHAAAYKHVPILEAQVREAVKNNVLGTRVLADAAAEYGCHKFVLISTDKAVNPANNLGLSKRLAELYCEYMSTLHETRYITVRFGNVLDSDGSVVPLFREQIREGGPVTVTHPEVTRYFMTIPEATQLILQASAMGRGGEIFVLDMGKPVKINYLAEQMIHLSGRVPGKDIMIEYIGLRPGEKMYEELFYSAEQEEQTAHKKILLARHTQINWQDFMQQFRQLEAACNEFDENRLESLIRQMVPAVADASDKVIQLNKVKND
ncbi:MAG: polysaccharide biosynthesis protein [Thiotrichales bacterium]|nr:polysaccharide biosynthesis protein [Thiotrichales bacterium]